MQCLRALLVGESYAHLWYLYMLIGLYILTPVLSKLVQALNKKEFIYLLVIGFVISSLIPTLNCFTKYNLAKVVDIYEVLNLNICVLFYLLGYFLKKYNPFNIKISSIMLIIFVALLVCVTLYCNYISILTGTKVVVPRLQNFFNVGVIIFLFTFLRDTITNDKKCVWINNLGKLTFGIYLIHFIIEKELIKFGINANMFNPLIGNILVAMLIFVLSYAICFLISKIPYIRRIIGIE